MNVMKEKSKISVLMSLVFHKKTYFVCVELSNLQIFRNIYLFSSSCLCPCWLSQFCTLKKIRNRLREYSKIRQFDTYQIAFLMRNQGHKNHKKSSLFYWIILPNYLISWKAEKCKYYMSLPLKSKWEKYYAPSDLQPKDSYSHQLELFQ